LGSLQKAKTLRIFLFFLFPSAYESELSRDEGLASLILLGVNATKAKTLAHFCLFLFLSVYKSELLTQPETKKKQKLSFLLFVGDEGFEPSSRSQLYQHIFSLNFKGLDFVSVTTKIFKSYVVKIMNCSEFRKQQSKI
jgi:hypothetical protein